MAKDTFNLHEWVGNKERRLLKEDYNSYAEGQEKELIDLLPDEKFIFNGETYTFVKLDPEHKNTAIVRDSEGIERRITFGGGKVNREQDKVKQTGVGHMGQGKGHHIDEEEDRDEVSIEDLKPVSQELEEEVSKLKDYDDIIKVLVTGANAMETHLVDEKSKFVYLARALKTILNTLNDNIKGFKLFK